MICNSCLMDDSDPNIVFDEFGICNHCEKYKEDELKFIKHKYFNKEKEFFESLKSDKKYDCIVGLSGGVDSSYIVYLCKLYNINPLLVHVDTGWNSKTAVSNIKKLVEDTGFDLITHVVPWTAVKNMHIAMLKSNLANQDSVQDHIFFSLLYKCIHKYKIKVILNGSNFTTEGVSVPSWQHASLDALILKDVFKKHGNGSIKGYKFMSFFDYYVKIPFINQTTVLCPLNYSHYNKNDALTILKDIFDYEEYEYKHGESIFTSYFQNIYLINKYGFDKRKLHYSSLVLSNQETRQNLLDKLQKAPLNNVKQKELRSYICKKLGISHEELLKFEDSSNLNCYKNYNNWDGRRKIMLFFSKYISKFISLKTYH